MARIAVRDNAFEVEIRDSLDALSTAPVIVELSLEADASWGAVTPVLSVSKVCHSFACKCV